MPKLKTKRAAAKRLRTTATGKLKRGKAYHSHILTKKSQSRKRRLRQGDVVAPADARNLKKLVPYLT